MKETITGKELVLYILENDLMDKSIELGSATIHHDRSDNERDKELYEGDEVIVKKPYEIEAINGYSGAYCKCGHVLNIKTPRQKGYNAIKCPICGNIVTLFC